VFLCPARDHTKSLFFSAFSFHRKLFHETQILLPSFSGRWFTDLSNSVGPFPLWKENPTSGGTPFTVWTSDGRAKLNPLSCTLTPTQLITKDRSLGTFDTPYSDKELPLFPSCSQRDFKLQKGLVWFWWGRRLLLSLPLSIFCSPGSWLVCLSLGNL